MPSEVHRCELCTLPWPTAEIAARCAERDAAEDREVRHLFRHKKHHPHTPDDD